MGMVEVAAFAANAAGSPPVVVITATGRCTNSAAILGNLSYSPSAKRYWMPTF